MERLGKYALLSFIQDWLFLEEFATLEIATNRKLHSLICNCFNDCPQHVFQGYEDTHLSGKYIDWLSAHFIGVGHILANNQTIRCENLLRLKYIKSFMMSRCWEENKLYLIDVLKSLKHLTTIGVSKTKLDSEFVQTFNWQNITSVNFDSLTSLSHSDFVHLCSNAPNLTYCNVAHCPKVHDSAIIILAESCRQLKTIVLCSYGTGISDRGINSIANCSISLTSLNICYIQNISEEVVIKLIKNCLFLKELLMSNVNKAVSNAALTAISEHLPNIITLDISNNNCKIQVETIEKLCKQCAHITDLNMKNMWGMGDSVLDLAALNCSLPKLRKMAGTFKTSQFTGFNSDQYGIFKDMACSRQGITSLNFNNYSFACSSATDSNNTTDTNNTADISSVTSKADFSHIRSDVMRRLLVNSANTLTEFVFSGPNDICNCFDATLFVRNCPLLQKLSLSDHIFTTPLEMKTIAENCNLIVELTIINCLGFNESELCTLIVNNHRTLKMINVSYTSSFKTKKTSVVSDVTLNTIAANCRKLTSLDITYLLNITDSGLINIADKCLKLRELRLQYCRTVTTAAVDHVMRVCKHLDVLSCGCDPNFDIFKLSHLYFKRFV